MFRALTYRLQTGEVTRLTLSPFCLLRKVEVKKILFQLLYLKLLDFASATKCPSSVSCIHQEISVVFTEVLVICPLSKDCSSSLTY